MVLLKSILNFFSSVKSGKKDIHDEIIDLLSSNTPAVIYRVRLRPTWKFLYVSNGVFDLLGYTPEEFYNNSNLRKLTVAQEDHDKLNQFFEYPPNTKAIIRLRFVHKNGSTIHVEHHVFFQENEVTGMVLDVTEKVLSENKLKESEERLVVALQTTGVAIWEWDIETSVVTWKNSVEDVFGVNPGIINENIQSYFSLIHPEDKEHFLETISSALKSSDHYLAEHRIIDKTGSIRWIEAYAQIFRDPSGKTIRWLGTLRNITDRQMREIENRELYDRTRLQSQSIVELALSEAFYGGDLNSSLHLILKIAAEVLNVCRSSVWMFREDYSSLDCLFMYDNLTQNFLTNDFRLISSEVPIYFQSILNGRVLVSNDVINDSRTIEFQESYSKQVGLKSIMDASIRVKGKIVGIFSIESLRETRVWKSDEVMFAGLLADQVAISIINSERKQTEDQIKLLNKNLERMIEERTLQLKMTNKDLSSTLENLSKTQNQLILSEKMASLGQLIAGIAHEINNPIGTIKASLELIRSSKSNDPLMGSVIPNFLENIDEDLYNLSLDFYNYGLSIRDIPTGMNRRRALAHLQEILSIYEFTNLFHLSEKLVDIGITAIPDRFNTLLKQCFSQDLIHYLCDKIFEEKNYESIEYSIGRVSSLVRSLKNFTHIDKFGEKTTFDIKDSIETVITLFYSKLKQGIEVIKRFDRIPSIACFPDDLMQLWTNLIQNAIQAMEFKGTLEIAAWQEKSGKSVIVEIIDSGKGIKDEYKDKIFQPFFTTKSLGEGSGLGLDICKKIVESHNGKISFESSPGRTCFRVELPIS